MESGRPFWFLSSGTVSCDTDPLFTVQLQEEELEEEQEKEQEKETPSQTGPKFNVPQALR